MHPFSVGFSENHPPMKSFLGAPINHRGRSLGSICLAKNEGSTGFSVEDEEILVMFASQASVAIANALRHDEERRVRDQAEAERRRLAALVESSPVG